MMEIIAAVVIVIVAVPVVISTEADSTRKHLRQKIKVIFDLQILLIIAFDEHII